MNLTATIANGLWCAGSLASWSAFRDALRRPHESQAQVLATIVHGAKDSAFGRAHRFDSIKTPSDYRDRVPLRDYTEFEPWIDRIRRGEQRVLTSEPVKRLA